MGAPWALKPKDEACRVFRVCSSAHRYWLPQGPEPVVDVGFSGPGAANTVGGFVGGEAPLGVSCGKLG
jgi:hypothetical protein